MKIGTSFSVEDISDIRELVPSSDPVVFVVGAFAHGKVQSGLCCALRFFVERMLSAGLHEQLAFTDGEEQGEAGRSCMPAPALTL